MIKIGRKTKPKLKIWSQEKKEKRRKKGREKSSMQEKVKSFLKDMEKGEITN